MHYMFLRRLFALTALLTVSWLISSPFIVYNSSSASSYSHVLADGFFDIEFETATNFKILARIDVNEITVFDTTYDREEIKKVAVDNPEILGAIKLRLRDLVKNQIEKSFFEKANVSPLYQIPSYENYEFHDEFSVDLTSAYFALNETVNVYDFINGVLDMGSIVSYGFNFQAESGWDNTYRVFLPSEIKYRRTTGSVEGNRIQWMLKNTDGGNPELSAELSIQHVEPTLWNSEDIRLEFLLDTSNVNKVALKTIFVAKSIDVREYLSLIHI